MADERRAERDCEVAQAKENRRIAEERWLAEGIAAEENVASALDARHAALAGLRRARQDGDDLLVAAADQEAEATRNALLRARQDLRLATYVRPSRRSEKRRSTAPTRTTTTCPRTAAASS